MILLAVLALATVAPPRIVVDRSAITTPIFPVFVEEPVDVLSTTGQAMKCSIQRSRNLRRHKRQVLNCDIA